MGGKRAFIKIIMSEGYIIIFLVSLNFNQDQSDKREALSVLKLYLIYQTQNPVIVIQIIKKN